VPDRLLLDSLTITKQAFPGYRLDHGAIRLEEIKLSNLIPSYPADTFELSVVDLTGVRRDVKHDQLYVPVRIAVLEAAKERSDFWLDR
jgi:hypothetical protein